VAASLQPFLIFLAVWQMAKHPKKRLQTLAVRLIAGWMHTLRMDARRQSQASQTHPGNLCNASRAAFIQDSSTKPKLKE
jgi:hypothetical protein